jgi:hypothetical protein
MPIPTADPVQANRLRFVCDDTVLSLDLAADATMGDVARAFADLAHKHRRNLVAIDVTMAMSIAIAFSPNPPITSGMGAAWDNVDFSR